MVGIDDAGITALHDTVEVCENNMSLPFGGQIVEQILYLRVDGSDRRIDVCSRAVAVEDGRNYNLRVWQVLDHAVDDIRPRL